MMAIDLAHTPFSGIEVVLRSLADSFNFGVFATPERKPVFDVNDRCEGLPGRRVGELEAPGHDDDRSAMGEAMTSEGKSSDGKRHKHSFLYRLLFLDLLTDQRTRFIIIYAVLIIAIGAALYQWLEDWSWLDSVYFVVVTLTTIGYGDLTPTTPLTKLITIFYGLNGIIILLTLFDAVRRVRRWEIRPPEEST